MCWFTLDLCASFHADRGRSVSSCLWRSNHSVLFESASQATGVPPTRHWRGFSTLSRRRLLHPIANAPLVAQDHPFAVQPACRTATPSRHDSVSSASHASTRLVFGQAAARHHPFVFFVPLPPADPPPLSRPRIRLPRPPRPPRHAPDALWHGAMGFSCAFTWRR